MNVAKKGLLLLNLGSPSAPETAAVRKYLAEFLMDKFVVDLPYISRWLLVHGIILRTRPAKSAAAYREVWTDQGSPLIQLSRDITDKVEALLSDEWSVKLAMRYAAPSIETALLEFRAEGIENVVLLPLYPQYAESSTRSSLDRCDELAEKIKTPDFKFRFQKIPYFYNDPDFIEAWAEILRPLRKAGQTVVFTYHGLPERQLVRMKQGCEFGSCCNKVTEKNQYCYRAHCFETTRHIAKSLNLKPDEYIVSFQSRLGTTPWIRPFTDETLKELPAKGVKSILIVSPSFVADCLETLEELGIRGREIFLENGGTEYILAPCLNGSERLAVGLKKLVEASRTV